MYSVGAWYIDNVMCGVFVSTASLHCMSTLFINTYLLLR